MKVYVVGNCQAVSLAACLRAMLPRIDVERFPLAHDVGSVVTGDDLVFRQRNAAIPWTLRAPRDNEFLFPRIWFNGFHPDFVQIAGKPGAAEAPFRVFHSSLVLYAWHRGLSVSQTARLFCEAVYERLGFRRYWDVSKRALLAEGESIGFALDTMFARWQRTGPFMHIMLHPALIVMADVARELVRRARLRVALEMPEYYLNDPLKHLGVLPVYPEIADGLGVSGSYAFMKAQPVSWTATPDIIGLDQFIEESFAAYATSEASALTFARLDTAAYRDLEGVARTGSHRRDGAGRVSDDAVREEESAALERSYRSEREVGSITVRPDPDAHMEPLAPSSFRAPLDIELPRDMTVRTVQSVRCTVKNDGDVTLVTGGKHPVFVCYRWYDERGDVAEVGNSIHTWLPSPVLPGGSTTLEMSIRAPQFPGRYRLCAALLQSEIAWFDDVDPRNGVATSVDVVARGLEPG